MSTTLKRQLVRATAATAAVLMVLAVVSASIVATATPGIAAAMPKCNATQHYLSNPYEVIMPSYADGGNVDAFYCYLSRGDKDYPASNAYGVALLQKAINICYGRGLVVDGSYGSATEGAVKYVQRYEGLIIDGSFGSATRWSMKWPVYSGSSYLGWCWERW